MTRSEELAALADVRREAAFLLDRLRGFLAEDWSDTDELHRQWDGHVQPSAARLEMNLRALAASTGDEHVG